jgi:hypothetical protein
MSKNYTLNGVDDILEFGPGPAPAGGKIKYDSFLERFQVRDNADANFSRMQGAPAVSPDDYITLAQNLTEPVTNLTIPIVEVVTNTEYTIAVPRGERGLIQFPSPPTNPGAFIQVIFEDASSLTSAGRRSGIIVAGGNATFDIVITDAGGNPIVNPLTREVEFPQAVIPAGTLPTSGGAGGTVFAFTWEGVPGLPGWILDYDQASAGGGDQFFRFSVGPIGSNAIFRPDNVPPLTSPVQAAIDAAVALFGPGNNEPFIVVLLPGTYVGDITIPGNCHVVGFSDRSANTIIQGFVTFDGPRVGADELQSLNRVTIDIGPDAPGLGQGLITFTDNLNGSCSKTLRDVRSFAQFSLLGPPPYSIIVQDSVGRADIFDSEFEIISIAPFQPAVSLIQSGAVNFNNCDIIGTALIPGETPVFTGGFALTTQLGGNASCSFELSRISGNIRHDGDGAINAEYTTFRSFSALPGGLTCIDNAGTASLNLEHCHFATSFSYSISSPRGTFYENTFERNLLSGVIPTFDYAAVTGGVVDFGGSNPQNTVGFSTLSRTGEAIPTSGGVAAVQANDFFAVPGDAQTSQIVAKAVTTGDVAQNLEVINNVGLPVSPITLQPGKTYAITMSLSGRRTLPASPPLINSYFAEISFLVGRAGIGAPSTIGIPSVNVVANPSIAGGLGLIGFIGDDLILPVVGLAGETWRWVARINYIEVGE